ncbi:hypothetical protein [Fodinicola feengrottensis]|uniref:hypothetical protein n=1 Tax=Fodinicola feengrottensis TaxID=435914 RepID=UPI0013D2E98B|nr:hypothetical protein [Fodinicola feengrottensis]
MCPAGFWAPEPPCQIKDRPLGSAGQRGKEDTTNTYTLRHQPIGFLLGPVLLVLYGLWCLGPFATTASQRWPLPYVLATAVGPAVTLAFFFVLLLVRTAPVLLAPTALRMSEAGLWVRLPGQRPRVFGWDTVTEVGSPPQTHPARGLFSHRRTGEHPATAWPDRQRRRR